jgi:hypothetical protein
MGISQWWTRGGKPASLSLINQPLGPAGVQALTPEVFRECIRHAPCPVVTVRANVR